MITNYPEIKVKLDPGAYLPERAHDTDAGADIRTPEAFTLQPHRGYVVHTGVHIELPPTTKCEVKSKSGLWVRHGIFTTGLIDEGFSGEIVVRLFNTTSEAYRFEVGEKITQLCVSPVCYPTYHIADEIASGARGSAGYGSTGRL
jgi:dUTP pyrophosphatase